MHDRSTYQGKNLLRLLLALGLPALILYFGNVLAFAASETRVSQAEYSMLIRASRTLAVLFFVAELGCARYVQRLLARPSSRFRSALQYLGALLLCVFISAGAAIACESFGYTLYMHARRK